jgi:twitching motility protein PilT
MAPVDADPAASPAAVSPAATDAAPKASADTRRLDRFLALMVERGASDLHLSVGRPPMFRLSGDMEPIRYRTLTEDDYRALR